jgi:hypothetical protein
MILRSDTRFVAAWQVFKTVAGARGWLAIVMCVTLFAGCLDEEEGEECTPAPWDCELSRPTTATLEIRTGGGAIQAIRVYAGSNIEDGRLVWSGTSGGTRSISLPLGPYAAEAEYLVNGVTYIAVDGDELTYTESETCDGTCYETVDGLVELQLEPE